jgi:hypothetical protein
LRALARRYGINQKTVAKWKKRNATADLPTGPKDPKSTSLSLEDEAIIVAFRQHTLLPLDDCLYALQATIPHLTRSSLHRCLQRHGISRLPDIEDGKGIKRKFKAYPIGYFHIDIAEVRTAEGRLYLFVAIDRTSKFALTELHDKATRRVAADFLLHLIKAVPYKIHTVLTDNGTHFTDPRGESWSVADIKGMLERGEPFWAPAFEVACARNNIDHRQAFSTGAVLFSFCARATACPRAGCEDASPAAPPHDRRSSFAALVRTLGPRGVQPATNWL